MTTTYNSSLLRLLEERGHIHQMTDAVALDALACKETITAYVGFDPTAPSLHVGNLASIMLLRRVQQAGHRPIVIMGGGTAKVGDPSGKDDVRKMLTDAQLKANIASIKGSFEKILDFGDGPTGALLIDNDDWLSKLGYIELLRDVGPHFTINRMLTFDSVKLRLDREQPLTFLEFNYMILQAYDFLKLARDHGCRLQLGGSDQWGNIVNGIDLARRIDGAELFGVTGPLVTTADGKKMGKSVSGAVWLNEDALPGYDFWQYWRNVDDRDVGRFLRLFTDEPLEKIERLERHEGRALNEAKVELANAVTTLCRGPEAARIAAQTAEATFGPVTIMARGHGSATSPGHAVGIALPTLVLPDSQMGIIQISIIDALVGLGFAASRGEAKRLIAGGGARVDGEPVTNESHTIALGDNDVRVSSGKKKHGVVRKG